MSIQNSKIYSIVFLAGNNICLCREPCIKCTTMHKFNSCYMVAKPDIKMAAVKIVQFKEQFFLNSY